MKLQSPWLINAAGWLLCWATRLLHLTLRRREWSFDGQRHPCSHEQGRHLYLFWHEAILTISRPTSLVTVLTSTHKDGDVLAQFARGMGWGVIRGSTKRNGRAALRQMLALSKQTHLVITPDGPRGPRRQLQAGAVYLASRTGLPIIVLGCGYTRAWRAKSWDRFAVPLPFSGVTKVTMGPIRVPKKLDRDGLEHYRQLIEQRLSEVTEAAERWAKRFHDSAEEAIARPSLAGESLRNAA